jgi:hypothetical protein
MLKSKLMLKWIWIAPIVLLAGCSRSNPANPMPVSAATAPPPYAANAAPPANGARAASPVAAVSPFGSEDATGSPAVPPAVGVPAIPAGTRLRVRLDEQVDTKRNRAGDGFRATLMEPVGLEGRTVLPTGTQFHGHLTSAKASGRLKGRAVLGLTLDGFELEGRDYRVQTGSIDRVSASHKKRNIALIGGGAGLGALIGGLAGGGKGAAIGAGAGGGAGLAGAAATGKREVAVNAEAALTFVLEAPVRM